MGGKGHLGEFELMVMLAVMHRRGEAYGVTIAEELDRRTGRTTSRGALYVTLKRLDEKGYLTSHLGSRAASDGPHDAPRRPPTPRLGRSRRYYEPTDAGIAATRDARATMTRMWAGLEKELEA